MRYAHGLISHARRLGTMLLAGFVTGMATGQPEPIPEPAEYTDLGVLEIGRDVESPDVPVGRGEYKWFKFRLTGGITPASWIDLDTARSTIDTEMCLYDARANRIIEDADSGGRAGGSFNTASGISIGGGSGQRLGESGPGWIPGHISTGLNPYNGTQIPTLRAGVYFVGVAGYDATFPDPNPNWQVSTSATTPGTVRLRIRTGQVPATRWNEAYQGWDAGDTRDTAHVVAGRGPLTEILTVFGTSGRDMFKIRVENPSSFGVVATPTYWTGGTYRVRLFMFDAEGRGVVAMNNTNQGTETLLSLPASAGPGEYYLAINNYCGSPYGDPSAFDTQGRAIWAFERAQDWNRPIPPNGPGATGVHGGWGRTGPCENIDAYLVRLSLTGAWHIESCSADVDDGGGGGEPDGAVTIDDLLYFLERYAAGC